MLFFRGESFPSKNASKRVLQEALVYTIFEQRVNTIKLSQGEHAGSPLQAQNTQGFVGAVLRVCP
ncbi:MAG: hypothetical protein KAI83_13645 [Thiomargarita sp.]|nr:hypothetical protein [Thiomargarita sp.]